MAEPRLVPVARIRGKENAFAFELRDGKEVLRRFACGLKHVPTVLEHALLDLCMTTQGVVMMNDTRPQWPEDGPESLPEKTLEELNAYL